VRHINRQFSKRQKDYKRIEKRTEHIIVNMLRDGKQEFLHHTKPCPLTRKNIDFARHQNITRLIFFFCRAMIKSCLAVSYLNTLPFWRLFHSSMLFKTFISFQGECDYTFPPGITYACCTYVMGENNA